MGRVKHEGSAPSECHQSHGHTTVLTLGTSCKNCPQHKHGQDPLTGGTESLLLGWCSALLLIRHICNSTAAAIVLYFAEEEDNGKKNSLSSTVSCDTAAMNVLYDGYFIMIFQGFLTSFCLLLLHAQCNHVHKHVDSCGQWMFFKKEKGHFLILRVEFSSVWCYT